MSIDKLKNWQQSVEIDYLSLYIKTWFAFLSSLKELHPDIHSDRGDGKLVKHYASNMSLPTNYDSEIKSHIEKAYIHGKKAIERDLPDSFYKSFYSTNADFQYSIPDEIGHTKFAIQCREEKEDNQKIYLLSIEFNSTQAKFSKMFRVEKFNLDLEVFDFIKENFYDERDKSVDYVIEKMKDIVHEHVNNMSKLKPSGIDEREAYTKTILREIDQQWRPNFYIEKLFQPLPVAGFPDNYEEDSNKITVIKWFINFSYNLRNILFHHIIDPFDTEWLKLFKHTYLALKEIVNHNINRIEHMSPVVARSR